MVASNFSLKDMSIGTPNSKNLKKSLNLYHLHLSEYACSKSGVTLMTEKLDIVSEIPKAPEMIQEMFAKATLIPIEGMTILQG